MNEIFMVAAQTAANIYGERMTFLKSNAPSRARVVAVMAVIRAFPHYRGLDVARALGFVGDAKQWQYRVFSAKRKHWFKDADLNAVIRSIGGAEKASNVHEEPIERDNKRLVNEESQYTPGAQFIPRRRLSMESIFVPTTPKPRNVTSTMCGDPPPGRREYLASIESKGYRASNLDSETTYLREVRRRKASQRAKENQAN